MKRTVILAAAAASLLAPLAPLATAPVAGADVCAAGGGRHFSVGGCTNIAGDVTAAAIASQHVPYVPGEVPCYTVEGVPYYTPPGQPC